jgi:DNA-binding FadR family transcriptional regulator
MTIQYKSSNYLSEFLQFLAAKVSSGEERLPSLSNLSKELKISVASLREQLEIARVFGFVEVRPKTGIKWLPYQFAPSILVSVAYAITISPEFFDQFRDFRNHLESAYFYEAAKMLSSEEITILMGIVQIAERKIQQIPPILPHREHCELHQILFSHIDNVFLQGVLEGYWDIYEDRGFSVISDLEYLNKVWKYHRSIVEALRIGDLTSSFNAFLEHKDLIKWSPKTNHSQKFE